MADIDPAEVMRSHNQHGEAGCFWTAHLWGGRCEPYRLAEALAAVVNLHTGLHRCIVDGVAADYLYCPTARAIGVTTPDPYLRSNDA